MTEDLIIEVLTNAFYTTLLIILPVLGASLVVGIIISIFQAVTIIFLLPWMMDKMLSITNRFFTIFLTLLK